jgi:choice-of-anchor B domain-containing protein
MMRALLGLLAASLCVGAQGQDYESSKVRLLSQVPLGDMPTAPGTGAGVVGFTSRSGREYAIMGVRTGFYVAEVTGGTARTLTTIEGPHSLWHEVAVLGNYAYGVTEAGGGMQIIDLSQADTGTVTLASTFTWAGNSRAHTIQANSRSKTLFLNGSANVPNGGLLMLNAANPTSPVISGVWDRSYVHDVTVVNYAKGPWAGKEIVFASCGYNGLYILDVTDKANIVTLSHIRYLPAGTFCHSGVLSADGKFFYINDEFDEGTGIFDTATTHVINVEDLANPTIHGTFTNLKTHIDHNSMPQGKFIMMAGYTGGLRVYDAGSPDRMKETGWFDTHPEGDYLDYQGAWGVYAGFRSGNVLISDINRGLFVLDPGEAMGDGASIVEVFPARPNAPELLRRIDGRIYILNGFRDTTALMLVRYVSATKRPRSLAFTGFLRSYSDASIAVELDLYDWGAGEFVTQRTWTVPQAYTTLRLSRLPAGRYMSEDGEIQMQLRVRRLGGTLTAAAIDMLRMEAL